MMHVPIALRVAAIDAVKKWGLKFQFMMLFEEMGELTKTCTKYLRYTWDRELLDGGKIEEFKDHIAEEIADVYILLCQIMIALYLEERVNYWIDFKTKRLQELINDVK
jgi:NTP pyrophosphatase (non-canonical NTP hydrolase)